MSSWSARPVSPADAAQIDELLQAKADRLEALDPRLRLARRPTPGGFTAVNGSGRIGGHLRPELVELAEDDELRSFAADRAVSWRELAVNDTAALAALVSAVRTPEAADAAAWPAADGEAAPVFADVGLEPVFAFALRPPGPLSAGRVATVRVARPDDADAISALHLEEVRFHEPHTPYVRVVPALEPAFRSRLERMWSGEDRGAGVHVLEVDGAVAGMCESMVQAVRDEGGQLHPGRYGYLISVAVGAAWRGRGFGRTLISAVIDDLTAQDVDGYTLWFAIGNPLASRVWPQLGFRPLWISYERRVAVIDRLASEQK
jgi:ribosomal protein S18 acetylase RimI-like enzyme